MVINPIKKLLLAMIFSCVTTAAFAESSQLNITKEIKTMTNVCVTFLKSGTENTSELLKFSYVKEGAIYRKPSKKQRRGNRKLYVEYRDHSHRKKDLCNIFIGPAGVKHGQAYLGIVAKALTKMGYKKRTSKFSVEKEQFFVKNGITFVLSGRWKDGEAILNLKRNKKK